MRFRKPRDRRVSIERDGLGTKGDNRVWDIQVEDCLQDHALSVLLLGSRGLEGGDDGLVSLSVLSFNIPKLRLGAKQNERSWGSKIGRAHV